MKNIKYTIYQESEHFVARCLNVEVSSFGALVDEAIQNITEAVKLYFEDNDQATFMPIDLAMIGEKTIQA